MYLQMRSASSRLAEPLKTFNSGWRANIVEGATLGVPDENWQTKNVPGFLIKQTSCRARLPTGEILRKVTLANNL
jgi:hypothetical protein